MNREQVLELAREAGFKVDWQHADVAEIKARRYEQFAALVEAATKERCAQVCEAEAEKWEGDDGPICHEARLCAVNIRSMK